MGDEFAQPARRPTNGLRNGEAARYINGGGPEAVTELSAGQSLDSVPNADTSEILKSETEHSRLSTGK